LAAVRAARVAKQLEAHPFYAHPGLRGLPMMTTAPTPAVAWLRWAVKVAVIYVRLAGNSVEAAIRARAAVGGGGVAARLRAWTTVIGVAVMAVASGGGPSALRKAIEPVDRAADEAADALAEAGKATAADPYEPYRALFATLPVPPIALAAAIESDEVFARLRVAGPNPMVLTRVRAADDGTVVGWLTDSHLRAVAGCGGDTIAAAVADHRLYVADYRGFAAALHASSEATGVTDDPDMTGGADGRGAEVLLGPVAVFALPPGGGSGGRLLPVAILPDGKLGTPALTPADGTAWTAAKAIVNAADGAHHELDTHLARTHLFVNLAMGCTSRRLSATHHPVWRLLTPHADGTAFINNLTPHTLLAKGGDVHLLLPASRAAQVHYVGGIVTGARFNDRFPRTELAARGLLHEDALSYPYREDALAMYDAIHTFVADVLGEYYKSDADVVGDPELAAWAADISAPAPGGAGVAGFGELRPDGSTEEGTIRTFVYLVKAVTLLIWTASAQHAAANFPQADLMACAAAYPLAVRAGPPSPGTTTSITEWLPPLRVAGRQLFLGNLLGGVVHLPLGTYPLTPLPGGWFRSARGAAAVSNLRRRLGEIDARIGAREAGEKWFKYEYLRADRVPRSINI